MIEVRSAQLADVNFPQRLIELIVMPYEVETEVLHHGRMIREVCTRGAYGNVHNNARRIAVNRDHDHRRICGKAVTLHPSREEGLVAELKMSRTQDGEEALVLADDGILDASAGFELLRQGPNGTGPVYPDAEVWDGRGLRRLNRLKLDHIALVPDPAYTDARVLAVRNAQEAEGAAAAAEPTPNLDQLRYDEYRALEAVIDDRYGLRR
jgi:uncharacterized protein